MDHQREPGSAAQGEGAHQGFGVNGAVAAYQIHMDGESASTGGSTSHQEITLESLQQANLLSNLFSQYDSVVYTEDYPDGYGDTTYIIETDTGYALWYGNTMNGYYNEFIFFADGDEPDRMTAWPFGIMPEWLDDFVGDGLLPTEDDELIFQESGGGETVFYIEDADYDDVDIVYTVDSETLVLKTIERMNDNDESLSITTFHYGEDPFLAEIDENHIIGSTGHLYCIVPVDENATVAINRVQWNENTYTYENTEVCYRSESGEPVLFFANLNGVAYEADTQVWITDNSGNSCEWYPSLDSMSYLWPCISETGDYLSFDFTEYGWQDVSSELAPWLSDGYSGVYSWWLEGCWTTQAAAWDTGRTANYYLWFFPEDENGGSVDLDWQYEGSDLFEEMWGGYWEITSVMDGPSYVTISLSLVGGENYGVTDGPYYISETYPLLISPSGEEMVLGAGENGVSLPFMPQDDPQPYTLTLDSWFTESSVW